MPIARCLSLLTAGTCGTPAKAIEDALVSNKASDKQWSLEQQASFIQSIFLGLPLPSILLWLDPIKDKLRVIDGNNRLLALSNFLKGDLPIKAPHLMTSTVQGKVQYKDLHPHYKRKLLKFSMRLIVLEGNEHFLEHIRHLYNQ